jgi:hypothetical protein
MLQNPPDIASRKMRPRRGFILKTPLKPSKNDA